MTNEECIQELKEELKEVNTWIAIYANDKKVCIPKEKRKKALEMAIKELEQQSCEYKPLIIDKPKDEDVLKLLKTFQNQKVLVAEHDCLPSVTLLAEPCEDAISRKDVMAIIEWAYDECKIDGYTDYCEMRDMVKVLPAVTSRAERDEKS